MSLRNVLLLLPVVALTLAGCSSEKPAEAPVRPVLSVVAKPTSHVASGFVGAIAPQVSVDQAFRIGGTLVARSVAVGATVAAGDTLATLDATSYELALETARANLQTAEAQYANATASEGRLASLNQSDVVSVSNLEEAQQQAEAARAAVVQAQSRVTQAEQQLGYATLQASIGGVVTATGAEAGAVVAAGQSVITIAQPDARDLVIDVPEDVVQSLKPGTMFSVSPQLAPDVVVRGTLREIAPQADPITRTWRLRIGLENPTEHFWLGTTAIATLSAETAGSIHLPASAIRSDGSATTVWLVDPKTSTVSQRPVVTKADSEGGFEILSGLSAGERVVIAGVNSLTDGQTIKLDEEQQGK